MKRLVLMLLVIVVMFAFIKQDLNAGSTTSVKENIQVVDLMNDIQNYDFLVSGANCTDWSKQFDGCYERVCCCDQNGQMWCERCCPDANGDCTVYRIRCQ